MDSLTALLKRQESDLEDYKQVFSTTTNDYEEAYYEGAISALETAMAQLKNVLKTLKIQGGNDDVSKTQK